MIQFLMVCNVDVICIVAIVRLKITVILKTRSLDIAIPDQSFDWFSGHGIFNRCAMAAKPIKSLEWHYTMIQLYFGRERVAIKYFYISCKMKWLDLAILLSRSEKKHYSTRAS